MVALVAAIVITGFWEFLIQEIKLKRLEQKRRRMTATNQNVKSDRGRGRGIGVGGGRHLRHQCRKRPINNAPF